MSKVIRSIWDLTTDNRLYTHAEVTETDVQLRNAYKSISECLKWHSIAQYIANSPRAVVQKALLQVIYHRVRIVLH